MKVMGAVAAIVLLWSAVLVAAAGPEQWAPVEAQLHAGAVAFLGGVEPRGAR